MARQTSLVPTLAEVVNIFTLDRAEVVFKPSRRRVESLPPWRQSSPSTHRIIATEIYMRGRSSTDVSPSPTVL